MRVLSPILILAAFVSLHLPAALAQGSEAAEERARETSLVTFYGHIFGHSLNAPMPANTQFPFGEDNYGLGTFDWCTPAGRASGLPPAPDPTGLVGGGEIDPAGNCDNDPNNKLALFSTAGFVQVTSGSEFTGGGGYVQLHNERGSTKNIVLDTSQNVFASLFLSQDFHAWAVSTSGTYCYYPNPPDTGCLYPYWGWDPGYVPAFTVKASLYYAILGEYGGQASDQPPIREALESGSATLVAEGQTTPKDVQNGVPGSPNVHEFVVDLGTPKVNLIPKEANFFLVFSFYSDSGGNKASLHTWRIWGGEFFPPRFSLPVKNAFDVELVVPQFVYDKIAILGIINTPWGSYDVDPAATVLTLTDPTGSEIAPVRIEAFADYSVAHGAHYKPVNVTYVWDYKADKARPGTYTATVFARNHQGSASAICSSKFTILEGGLPGPIEIGACGQQTDEMKKAQQGDAAKPGAAGGGSALPPGVARGGDAPTVGVLSAGLSPGPAPLHAYAAAAVAIGLAGRALLRRGSP